MNNSLHLPSPLSEDNKLLFEGMFKMGDHQGAFEYLEQERSTEEAIYFFCIISIERLQISDKAELPLIKIPLGSSGTNLWFYSLRGLGKYYYVQINSDEISDEFHIESRWFSEHGIKNKSLNDKRTRDLYSDIKFHFAILRNKINNPS